MRLDSWLLVIATVAGIISVPILGAGAGEYSFVLDETGYADNPELIGKDPNTIFTYDLVSETAVVATTRLADAIAALGWTVRVDALSYGQDVGGRNNHTYHVFGISLTAAGGSRAAVKTPLWSEPLTECESDFFLIQDRPALSRSVRPHRKVIDDNTDSPVPSEPIGELESLLGVTGTYGKPRGVSPGVTNVSGFDLREHSAAYSIYFSIDGFVSHPSVAGGVSISPADISKLDPAGTISLWRTATFLGLDPDSDDVDAISLNLEGWGLPSGTTQLGWYSLTRGSAALTTYDHAAGDIFEFEPIGPGYSAPPIHIRSEYAGLLSRFLSVSGSPDIDADIDSITTMDPERFYAWDTSTPVDSVIEVSGGSPLETTYSVIVDDQQVAVEEASQVLTPLAIDEGDFVRVLVDGYRGPYRVLGQGVAEVPGVLDPVTELVATLIGSTVTWTWQNPSPNPYDTIEITIDDQPSFDIPGPETSHLEFGLGSGAHSIRIRGVSLVGFSQAVYGQVFIEPPPDLDSVETLSASDLGGGLFDVEWVNPVDFDFLEVEVSGQLVATVGAVAAGQTSGVTVAVPEGRSVITVRGFFATGSSVPSAVFAVRPPDLPGAGLALGGVVPPIADLAISPDGLAYVLDGSGLLQIYDLVDLTLPILAVAPPAPGDVQGVTADLGNLYWAIQEELWRTDPLGGGPLLLGPIVLPLGGALGALGHDGDVLWALDETNDLVSAHDPLSGAFIGLQFDAGGDPIAGIDARFGQPGFLQVAHGADPLAQHVSVFESDGQGVLTTLREVGPDLAAVAWGGAGPQGPVLLVGFADGQLLLVKAVSHLPQGPLRHCHDFVGSSWRVAESPSLPIPDGFPFGLVTALTVVGVPGSIQDLDVRLRVDHDRVGEVDVLLTSPAGTQIQLYTGEGGDQTIVDRVIDDTTDGTFNDGFGTRAPSVGNDLAAFDGEDPNGEWTLTVIDAEPGNLGSLEEWSLSICAAPGSGPLFERGDCNADASFDIADAIALLSYLFTPGGAVLSCDDACDANDDGGLDIGDAISILNTLFGGAGALPPPSGGCGEDPTPDGLDCDISTGGCP